MAEVSATGEVANHLGQEEQVAQGAATTEQVASAPPEGTTREAWWPEGVNTVEELKVWHENLGKADPAKEETASKEETPKAADAGETEYKASQTPDEVKASLKEAGGIYADPRYEPFALEVNSTGKLSDASIAKAAADFNVPENAVRDFFAGQTAKAQLDAAAATSQATSEQVEAGKAILGVFPGETGADDYQAMMAWGAKALPEDQRKSYDAAMDRKDYPTMQVLLKDFRTQFLASGEGPGRRDITNQGRTVPSSAPGEVKPFASISEGVEAMQTAKYRKDPGHRAEVDARYAATKA